MHEMSLCEGILRIIEDNADTQGFKKVNVVYLEIGALAGVEIEAIKFSFDAVIQNTLADGAQLKIVHVPGQAWCMQCAEQVDIKQRYDSCPKCGGYQLQVVSGEEMRVMELEVE